MVLKIQNDLFLLSQKKNIPESRHEKQRELPDYYLKSRLACMQTFAKIFNFFIIFYF